MRLVRVVSLSFVLFLSFYPAAASDFKIGPDSTIDSLSIAATTSNYLVVWRDFSAGPDAPRINGSFVSSGGIIVQAQTAGSPGSPSSASLNGNLTLNAATGHLSVTRSTLTLKGNLMVDNGAGAGIFNGSMTVHGANGISIGVNGSGSVSVEAGGQLKVDNGIARTACK